MQGSSAEIETQVNKLNTGRSILDTVADQANNLSRRSSGNDRAQLEQYFSSVRDLESRLLAAREWERKPKPIVEAKPPTDPNGPAQYIVKIRLMYEMIKLAFQTDSTRSVTLMLNSVGTPVVEIPGQTINDGYHNLSHHGKSAEKLAQLRVIDLEHMKLLDQLLTDLKSVQEQGETLLDRSMILYGSNLGDANAHSTTNMPIFFAVEDLDTDSTWHLIRNKTTRCPICLYPSCSRWELSEISLRLQLVRCGDSRRYDANAQSQHSVCTQDAASTDNAGRVAILLVDQCYSSR